jgi:very-short-patch-repair endonuclease
LNDLARRLPLTEAVAIADLALHAKLVALATLCPRLRKYCDPASESVMESHLRMLLILAGLPRPQSQAVLRDSDGRPLGRADLYYPEARLVIEYDGANHRERLVDDDRRQNAIVGAGYSIRRFTAPYVLGAPQRVAAEVRAALGTSFMKRPHTRRAAA